MPIYKNWQDFDILRDKNKVLVIYGAGTNGRKFIEHHKIVPDYFCDKNAKQIKNVHTYKCLTLKSLIKELNGQDADILVSNSDEKVIRGLHKIFDRTKFTKNTVIYFRCDSFDIYKINNITSRVYSIHGDFSFIKKNFDFLSILNNFRNAYFDSHFSSIEELEKYLENIFKRFNENGRIWKINFKNGRISHNILENLKSDYKAIYLFCDSRFNLGIDAMLNKNIGYGIENYSGPGFCDEKVIFQLTNAPLARNNIVIITRVLDAYQLLVAKQYCQKYNCRLIYYYIPFFGITYRKVLTDYEKWYIETSGLNSSDRLSEESIKKKIKSVAKAMDVEFYEPPEKFFNSDKTIFIDYNHFGDYGNEIITRHLHDIIINKKPDDFKNNANDANHDFRIEPEEKIEYAQSVIPALLPDIQAYLTNLKKHKKNEKTGAIVMNCNPFTLGHRYLIEYAASKTEYLYIFAVEEDKSEFPFKDRFKLIKQNAKDLKNITVLPSGKFIISSLTFNAYFGKSQVSEEQAIEQDVSFDLLIFAAAIAPTLNIKTRFVGEEPFDPVTRYYNEEMKKLLPEYGCNVVEIPRLEKEGGAVSASRVRKLLKEGNFKEIEKIVPKATLKYLKLRNNSSKDKT